jgi:hypothetical protein
MDLTYNEEIEVDDVFSMDSERSKSVLEQLVKEKFISPDNKYLFKRSSSWINSRRSLKREKIKAAR